MACQRGRLEEDAGKNAVHKLNRKPPTWGQDKHSMNGKHVDHCDWDSGREG